IRARHGAARRHRRHARHRPLPREPAWRGGGMSFADRTVMVTGAAGHLGKAVAAAFGAQGARLVLVDRERARLEAAFGTDANRLLVAADLLDPQDVAAALATATRGHPRVDALCHLVGGFRMGEAVHETTLATWAFLFA